MLTQLNHYNFENIYNYYYYYYYYYRHHHSHSYYQ